MRSYAVEKQQLAHTTFEEAEKIERECEAYWFRDGQQMGYWVPTRELARNAYRTMDNLFYRVKRICRSMLIIAVIEAIAIAAIVLLLAMQSLSMI